MRISNEYTVNFFFRIGKIIFTIRNRIIKNPKTPTSASIKTKIL